MHHFFNVPKTDGLVRSGLRAEYRFNEGGDQILTDYSGFGNDGQLGGNTSITTNDPNRVLEGLSFDGIDDYIRIPHNSSIKPTAGITLLAVVGNPSPWGTTQRKIMSCSESGGWCLGINVLSNVNYMVAVNRNAAYGFAGADISTITGNHMLTATFDGRYLKGFLDTSQLGGTNDGGGYFPIGYSINNPVMIGAEATSNDTPGAGEYWGGKMYYAAIYNRALSQVEISQNYKYLKSLLGRRGVTLP